MEEFKTEKFSLIEDRTKKSSLLEDSGAGTLGRNDFATETVTMVPILSTASVA